MGISLCSRADRLFAWAGVERRAVPSVLVSGRPALGPARVSLSHSGSGIPNWPRVRGGGAGKMLPLPYSSRSSCLGRSF